MDTYNYMSTYTWYTYTYIGSYTIIVILIVAIPVCFI